MESFKLEMPECSDCGSGDTKIDVTDCSNLFKIPASTVSAMMIGVPVSSVSFVCKECGHKFVTKNF